MYSKSTHTVIATSSNIIRGPIIIFKLNSHHNLAMLISMKTSPFAEVGAACWGVRNLADVEDVEDMLMKELSRQDAERSMYLDSVIKS